MPIDVARARVDTPGCENRIHFNNCGAALMPETVIDVVKNHIDLEAAIGGYEAAETACDSINNVYTSVARLLNCGPEEITIVENVTRAWDMAFYAMTFADSNASRSNFTRSCASNRNIGRKSGVQSEIGPESNYRLLNHPRLVAGGLGPFLHSGPPPNCVTVGSADVIELYVIGNETTHNRRVHGIGDRKRTEQIVATATESIPTCTP